MQIIPIASGKGGVGKSLLAANLSIALAQGGCEVVCADLDLGGSNLHIMLGLQGLRKGVGTFVKGFKESFAKLIIETDHPRLRFIPGDAEIPGLANLTPLQKNKLITGLKSIACDFLILDLGAGSSLNVLDFFLMSRRGLIITMPTLTSTLNAYLFLKNALFRLLSLLIKKKSKASAFMTSLEKDGEREQKLNFIDLLKKLKNIDPTLYKKYSEKTSRFVPRLVLNLVGEEKDAKYSEKLRHSLNEYLGIEAEHLGIIYRDALQDIALNSRIPIIVYKPEALLSQAIYRLADKIMQHTDEDAGLLELDSDETFEAAEIEARIDFTEKLRSIEELMYSGSLSQGDLLDIIAQQHIEVSNLKKENQLLKTKLSKAVQEGYKL